MPHLVSRSVLVVVLIWLAGLTAAGQFAKFAVPFDAVAQVYPDYAGHLGWLLTLVSGLGAVFGMTAGVFVTKIGPKQALVAALILGALCSFLQAALPGFWIMLGSRFLEGASHLALVVAAPTLIAQISSERLRGMALSLWSTFFGVTFALVAWIAPGIVAEYGLAVLFAGHGAVMLLLGPILAVLLPNMRAPESLPVSMLRYHQQAYSAPQINAPAFGWLFYTLTFVALLVVVPDLLADENASLILSLMPLASILVSLGIVPVLLLKISAIQTVQLGYVLAILVIGAMFLGAPMGISAVVLFGVLGLVQGASFAAVPQLNNTLEHRALANGAIAQMGNIGNLLGTPILLFVLAAGGVSGVLVAVAGLYAVAIIVHGLLARMRAVAR